MIFSLRNNKHLLIYVMFFQSYHTTKMTTNNICSATLKTNNGKQCSFLAKYKINDMWVCGHHVDKVECLICMETCSLETQISLPCCKHAKFHASCISRWVLSGHFTCPLCRTTLPASLDIEWFRLTEHYQWRFFDIMPMYHPSLMSDDVLEFLYVSGISFYDVLSLQYEQPKVYWEYANLIRYWLQYGDYDTTVISQFVGRKLIPFAQKYNLIHVIKNHFKMDI